MTPSAPMRVLVTYGSKRGGTAEIAAAIGTALRERALEVDCLPAARAPDVTAYDAVIVGGALYAARWVREARRFVTRNAAELRRRPVWMFSSGPLDATAARGELPPTRSVAALMARVGARGHATFGGRLAPDAQGFIASAMAKTHAGDWRDWAQVRTWALHLAQALEGMPRPVVAAPIPQPARWLLATLCLAVGVTAICGGGALVARPDGSLLHMPLAFLRHTPFASYAIPGWLLLVVIGLGNLVAGVAVARAARVANEAAFAGGVALFTWIVSEMVLLRSVHWLQVTYLVVALAIVTEALRRRAVQGHARGGRPTASAPVM